MPLFVARQWFKHTVGFVRNEVSRRYVDDEPEFWHPSEWRLRADNKKQGSSDETISYEGELIELFEKARAVYTSLLERDIAPEQARCVLPLFTYTEFIETGSLAAYARLYNLRMGEGAQKEITDYAITLGTHMEKLFPVSWEALTNEPA